MSSKLTLLLRRNTPSHSDVRKTLEEGSTSESC